MRPKGHMRWTEVSAADPSIRVHVQIDLTQVVDGELLDGTMHVTGKLPQGFEPFATTMRARVP